MLNVWATWCGPCKDELPSLQRLYPQYGPQGLKLVAVSIDDYVSEDSIRKFANNFGISFEILHDPTHAIETRVSDDRVSRSIRHRSTKARFDKKWIGPDDWNSQGNRALIAQLLGLPTPRPTIAGDALGMRSSCRVKASHDPEPARDRPSALRIRAQLQRRVVAALTDSIS